MPSIHHYEIERHVAPASPYFYQPTAWLLIVAALLFTLTTIAHLWYFVRGRTWFFWATVVGALMELTGFVARAVSARDLDDPYAFIVQYLTLVLAPSFLAAACYVVFGRIVWWVTPKEDRTLGTLWCPPNYVTLFFVTFDLGSFLIQLSGASSSARAIQDKGLTAEERQDRRERGLTAMRLGLVLQLICFVLFAVVAARFVILSRRWAGRPLRYGDPHVRWERLNWAVNAAAALILMRTVYRLFEFAGARDAPGYILSHEWLFWVLEGLPMLGVLIVLVVFHPAHYLPIELRGFWLNRRRLSKIEKSSPPSYALSGPIQATVYQV